MMAKTTHAPGRILALDLGEKRIGIALSDPMRMLARSHSVMPRRSRREDFAHLERIAVAEEVTALLVGLPVSVAVDGSPLGEEPPKVVWMRDYAGSLAERLDLPLIIWDESFSTVAATRSLLERGRRGRRGRAELDAVAAAMILQSYLDRQRDEAA